MACTHYEDSADFQLGECREQLNLVTRLLCGLCKELEAATETFNPIQDPTSSDAELIVWWEDHKRRDAEQAAFEKELENEQAEREKAERRRKDAIDSLTDEQREALGLDNGH